MKAYVVVGGPTEAAVLRAVLPPDLLDGITLVPAGPRSNLASVARTLLVTRRKPVAVLVDTDAVDEQIVRNRKQSTQELVAMVSSGVPTKVIPIVPHVEGLFFQPPGLIQKLFGAGLAAEVRVLGRYDPKKALEQLFALPGAPRDVQALLGRLDEEGVEMLRATPPIRELISFLGEAAGAGPKVAVME